MSPPPPPEAASGGAAGAAFLERLRDPDPLVGIELRPPRAGLSQEASIESWIDFHHTIRRLAARETVVFLTDNAVGAREEENLRHLTTNLAGEVPPSRVVPFLTCKHSLEYCLQYAERAAMSDLQVLTVLGGDREVGPPRCVEHAYILRQKIRDRVPSLTLGGWANPHADPAEQAGYLADPGFTAEFYLTQVISHHHRDRMERFLAEVERRDVPHPSVAGVFYYRSPRAETLERLSRFFPVPSEELEEEFAAGASPEEVCARSIRALRELGVRNVYVSNLSTAGAVDELERILDAVEGG